MGAERGMVSPIGNTKEETSRFFAKKTHQSTAHTRFATCDLFSELSAKSTVINTKTNPYRLFVHHLKCFGLRNENSKLEDLIDISRQVDRLTMHFTLKLNRVLSARMNEELINSLALSVNGELVATSYSRP